VGATVVSATARPNPAGVPYAADAYAGADTGAPGAPTPVPPTTPPTGLPPEDEGTSPLVWGAGALALLLLVVVAFFVFQAASGRGTPAPQQVTVPNFVGMTSAAASQQATTLGLTLTSTAQVASDQPEGQVLAQDPPAGTKVDEGSTVKITVATGLG